MLWGGRLFRRKIVCSHALWWRFCEGACTVYSTTHVYAQHGSCMCINHICGLQGVDGVNLEPFSDYGTQADASQHSVSLGLEDKLSVLFKHIQEQVTRLVAEE